MGEARVAPGRWFPDWQTVVVIVVLAFLLAPVAAHLLAAAVPGVDSFVVQGASMEPTIPSGALVYVAATGEYDVGDVVTYSQDGRTVTHRIVARTDGGYRTQGDANDAPDGYVVSEAAIHGEVISWVPVWGWVLATVAANRYLVLAVVGVLLVALGASLLRTALTEPDGG